MEIYQAIRDDIVLFTKVKLANDFFTRLVGLLKTKSLDSQQGLLLKKCRQVHTFGMKFNIDVVFLSREGEILNLEKNMVLLNAPCIFLIERLNNFMSFTFLLNKNGYMRILGRNVCFRKTDICFTVFRRCHRCPFRIWFTDEPVRFHR